MTSNLRVRRIRTSAFLLLVFLLGHYSVGHAQVTPPSHEIVIDAKAPGHPFPHFWEKMFGSGRAILALRASYLRDLNEVEEITGFQYVRFHAIFHDEVGIYDEDAQGQPVYNFSYADQIYDGLLAHHVRPFVELSFMPNKLAVRSALQSFWYKPNVSPPKDWNRWDALITAFVAHLLNRYGIDEVSKWYFEVWNEPNLDFWAGEPKQASYWNLYDHTARAIKTVSPQLRVGGPATAQAAWVDAFIQHCTENHVPMDFVSTHIYGDDPSDGVFGTNEVIPRTQMVCRAIKKVHDQVQASTAPQLPLIVSEFNATFRNDPQITDSTYMGPWLAETIDQCDGLAEIMSYWTFSDVFEEQGVVKTPFYGGFGLIAADDIPKPAFNALALLHKLGDQRITVGSEPIIVTRRNDNAMVVAVWNDSPPGGADSSRNISLVFRNTRAKHASISREDPDHGDVRGAYRRMGSPRYPTPAQVVALRAAAQLPDPESYKLKHGRLFLTLAAQSLAVIELK
jgi:xylan 1,4-beta-xylosidase